jgi:glycosyltransferase involved in cell wall biosynthesis
MNHRNNLPLVSIGIPTYNRAATYLPQALESALHQTYENLEIIVSDNGSTDNTESLVKHYGNARIKYHRQNPAFSPNENFNYCLNAAQGEYFLLLHDDDLIDPDFVEVCVRALSGSPEAGIIRTGTRVIDAQGNVIKEKRNQAGGLGTAEFFLAWFSGKTSLYLPSTLFNRRALQKIGGFESRHNLFQDVVAEVRLAAGYGRIDVEDVKAAFRVHDGEFTFAVSVEDWCEDAADLLDLMVELAPEKKEEVRRRGEAFFTELNYNRAVHIRNRAARFRMYVDIYRRFNSRLSPLQYFCIKPVQHRALKRIRQLERGVGLSPSSAIEPDR